MIPAQFQAADDVSPQVVLRGGRQRHGSVGIGRVAEGINEELLLSAVAQVFATDVQAQLLGCLVSGVAGNGPGFSTLVMNIENIQRGAEAQTLDRRGNRATDVIAGLVFTVAI